MHNRFAVWAALLGLAALVPATMAEERKAPPAVPTVIIRLKSLDGLIADIRYIVALAGKEEEAKQGEAVLKQFTGPKGIEGFDTKKPIGFYGKLGPNGIDSEVVAMLPIADEDAAVTFLNKFIKSEKGDDGVFTVNLAQSPFPIFFRFANGYAYGTIRDKDILDKAKLLKPDVILAPAKVGTLSATINLDQIPKQMKQMVIGQVELQAATEKEKTKPGETEAQQAFRIAVLDEATTTLKQVLTQGGAIDLRYDIDKPSAKLTFAASLAGLPGTKLAGDIAALAGLKSAVAGLIGPDSAMNVMLNIRPPAKLRKALQPVIEEGVDKALKSEKDASKRKLLELALKAMLPTLKAAELDAALNLTGPGPAGKYAGVMGLKIKNGTAIEKAIKEASEELPKSEQEKVKIDFTKVGDVNIHQVQQDNVDDKTKEMLGDGPIYLALRDDAVLFSGGENGLDSLKDAIGAPAKSGAIARVEIAVGKFAKALSRDQPGAVEAAKKAFAKDPQADKMRFTLSGGKALTLRFAMDAPLIYFFVLADEAKKKAQD